MCTLYVHGMAPFFDNMCLPVPFQEEGGGWGRLRLQWPNGLLGGAITRNLERTSYTLHELLYKQLRKLKQGNMCSIGTVR